MAFRLTPKIPCTSLSLPGGLVVPTSGVVVSNITPAQRSSWSAFIVIEEMKPAEPTVSTIPPRTGVFVFRGTEARGFRGILGIFYPNVPRHDLTTVEVETARRTTLLQEL